MPGVEELHRESVSLDSCINIYSANSLKVSDV